MFQGVAGYDGRGGYHGRGGHGGDQIGPAIAKINIVKAPDAGAEQPNKHYPVYSPPNVLHANREQRAGKFF